MKKLLIGFVALTLLSCESEKSRRDKFVADSIAKANALPKAPAVSKEVVNEFIQSIPSPIEISVLIKEQGAKYDSKLLNPTASQGNYNTSFRQAVNLGVYSTDLGYANIYDQKQDAIKYLDAVTGMANGLNIGQFFDFSTIKRLATNSSNLDSLLLITTQNFEKINSYLQDQNRSNQSVLILTGGWVESLYLTCEVVKKNPSQQFKERVGEQKVILDQLLLLLDFYKDDANVQGLINDLNNLKAQFDAVKVTREYKESKMEEINGIPTIVDKSTSRIDFTEKDIDNIRNATIAVRDKIIK
ncbi:hypothetical protein [Xanthocytophaga agilis]|uniref:Lipoprotein n=1 Tax=Xanthocytophaga agilis TaxID=3048010 RepID=A0AAE3UHD2_9BACT|nr:hypothetical protein [Xanthocytophaga agilis]MDJ1502533.1 hypothetical protein [Xanthocytophaga agilis]